MRLTTVLLTICAAAFCCRATCATTITFRMTGTIEVGDLDNLLPPDIMTGHLFTAFMTYDLSTPDSAPENPVAGLYLHDAPTTPNGLVIIIGGHTFESDPADAFKVRVSNGTPGEPGPAGTDVFAFGTMDVFGPGAVEFRTASFIWNDLTGTVFNSDALPVSLDIEDFDDPKIHINGIADLIVGGVGKGFTIVGSVEQMTLVPEPTAAQIGGAALLGFLAFLWLRNRPAQRLVLESTGGRPSKEGVKR